MKEVVREQLDQLLRFGLDCKVEEVVLGLGPLLRDLRSEVWQSVQEGVHHAEMAMLRGDLERCLLGLVEGTVAILNDLLI